MSHGNYGPSTIAVYGMAPLQAMSFIFHGVSPTFATANNNPSSPLLRDENPDSGDKNKGRLCGSFVCRAVLIADEKVS